VTRDDVAGRLVAAAWALADRGLVVGSLGNVSVRIGDRVLITPTRIPHTALTVDDLVTIDLDGRPVAGRWAPSRESPLHAAIHRRGEGSAVVHTHSVHATAWSFLEQELPALTEDLDYYDVGPVRAAPYAPPGSEQLAEGAVAALGASRAVLLERHGVVVATDTLEEAVTIAEVIERQAHLALLVRGGGAHHQTVPSTFSSSSTGRV
jgi:L-fuculose-phosphate aldolase